MLDRDIIIKKALEKLAKPKPPKGWWDQKYKEVKKENPSYSDEQIGGTVGKIWWHNMSDKDRKDTIKEFKS